MTKRKDDDLPIDEERIEGLTAIRKFIDPTMSESTFYRRWRRYLDPILIERPYYWKDNRPRYFTFRKYLHALMMRHKRL